MRDDITLERNPDIAAINWDSLLVFIHAAFEYMDGRIDPPSSLHRLTAADLKHKARTEILVLARQGNTIVGCMFCRDQGAYLYVGKIAIAPNMQGQGIGRAFIASAKKMANQEGMMGLELETRIELVENRHTFEKLGFVKVGEDAHKGYDRPTSIRMRLEL